MDFSDLPETSRDLIAAPKFEAESIFDSHQEATNELATVPDNLGVAPTGIGYSQDDMPLGMAREKLAAGRDQAATYLFGAIARLWWDLVKPNMEEFEAKLGCHRSVGG